MLLVKDIVNVIEDFAKPQYAYEWDNCGLCVGGMCDRVEAVLVALDCTKEVVEEAIERKCNLIITHHPLIFRGIKVATTDTAEGEIISLLYKNNISLYSAHTNLDIASGGVNDSLAKKLELDDVTCFDSFEVDGKAVSCARKGKLSKSKSGEEFVHFLKEKTGAVNVLTSGLKDCTVNTVALSTGAGEEFGFKSDADVFVTGEIKYHTALELKRRYIRFAAIGHYFSEVHFAQEFSKYLKDNFDDNIKVYTSKINTNPFDF